jgi:CHAD domain-containing protein
VRFQIDSNADPAAEIRRVLLEQIAHGRNALAGGASERGVHEARKACKRARATVALVHGTLDGSTARETDHAFRAAGRSIGPVRDSDVLKDLVTRLDLGVPVGEPSDRESRGLEATEALTAAEARVHTLDLVRITSGTFAENLARSYAQARSAHRVADHTRSPENLHDLRKATKRWLYQLQLLQPMDKDTIGPLADLADALQEQLGEHHDLSVLISLDATSSEVRQQLKRRAEHVEERALRAGAWLFAGSRSTFARWVEEVVSGG